MRISPLLISILIATAWGQVGQPPRSTQPNDPSQSQSPRPGTPGNNHPTYRPGATTDTTQIQPKVDDKKFLKNAAMGRQTEGKLGKLAPKRPPNESAKR